MQELKFNPSQTKEKTTVKSTNDNIYASSKGQFLVACILQIHKGSFWLRLLCLVPLRTERIMWLIQAPYSVEGLLL